MIDNKIIIAIPTFNRSKRLDKAIESILIEINKIKNKKRIGILISDNGSTDETNKIIEKHKLVANGLQIEYQVEGNKKNQGFDANVLNCYLKAKPGFIWFLSDDDNIYSNALIDIINYIDKYEPEVIYFNFNQKPNTIENPYIKEEKIYKIIENDDVEIISKMINCPKLSSLIIRKREGEYIENYNKVTGYGFIHIAIAIQKTIKYRPVIHTNKFIAYPDSDYEDNIDFPPYIGNNMEETVKTILKLNERKEYSKLIKFEKIDPLISSISVIAAAYKKNIELKKELKIELKNKIKEEFKLIKLIDIRCYEVFKVTTRLIYWKVVASIRSKKKRKQNN